MIVTKKMLLVLTLVGALVGAGIGSLITHTAGSSTAAKNYDAPQTANAAEKTPDQIAAEKSSQFSSTAEQTAYRQGFDEGYSSCTTAAANTTTRTSAVYREPASRSYTSSRTSRTSRRAYYDYGTAPRGRTFWQKHRDKLTLAMGTGGGALLGGLIGGKKGAGIGALAGAGSSALYTYKIRKRNRRY
jgi:outer membrane lipoprotein SlyB